MEQSWSKLQKLLDPLILRAIEILHFKEMTPVQAACIPQFVSNKDVAVEAVTGSGKTLAFVVPMMQMLIKREVPLKKYEVGAVILTPTRELAFQINEVVSHFLTFFPALSSCLFIGGESTQIDIKKFTDTGANIIICTPGRLEDLLQRKEAGFHLPARVKALEVLVLDEADRLLDMGFEASINTILSYMPKLRRTGLFSATQTDEVCKLIRAGLRNPLQITVKEKALAAGQGQRTPSTLKNYYMMVEADLKLNQLVRFLQVHKKEKIMVFFSTCACVDYFSKCLQHGVLMCTDVMARGVDIPDVNWVIQYDPPSSASAFVHRCGRTARIGNQGNALVMLLPTEDSYIKFIEINQKVPLKEMSVLEDATEMCTRVQTIALNDRSVYEKGLRAFVSFIQAYAKHECSMILRLKDLDFGRLAQGFGLLHTPRMPELKGKSLSYFQPVEVDTASIPFKDKTREKHRLARAATQQELPQRVKLNRPPKSEAWSKQKQKKERKIKRKEDKRKKGQKRKLEEDKEDQEEEELEDFESDIRLMKKLKKGKISKEEFDKEFAGDISD